MAEEAAAGAAARAAGAAARQRRAEAADAKVGRREAGADEKSCRPRLRYHPRGDEWMRDAYHPSVTEDARWMLLMNALVCGFNVGRSGCRLPVLCGDETTRTVFVHLSRVFFVDSQAEHVY